MTAQQPEALLPCPFCGAAASGYEIEAHEHSGPLKAMGIPDHQGSYVIEGDCECGSGLIGSTKAEVIERWNRRAPLKLQHLTDERIQQIDDETPFHESPGWNLRFARNLFAAAGKPQEPSP